jgi:hypothetical protein
LTFWGDSTPLPSPNRIADLLVSPKYAEFCVETEELIDQDRQFIGDTSTAVFTRDRILTGQCRMLEPVQHARLKEAIAAHFGIHSSAVVVVGSAKLGYSVSPHNTFKPFDDRSDIDVAVVDARLFERYWHEMYEAKQSLIEWPELPAARKYLFRGWIRPVRTASSGTQSRRS